MANKNKMDEEGIEPPTSCMQSRRSAPELLARQNDPFYFYLKHVNFTFY